VPKSTQIRNSNSWQLHAQCLQFGAEPVNLGIAQDTREALGEIIGKAAREHHLILLTGGDSMGDFDLVPLMLKEAGFEILFEKVAIQPGKPTVFGRMGNRYVFGLPGNPVSSFTVFEILVKVLLSRMMGLEDPAPTIRCPLAQAFKRRATARLAWIPVRISPEGLAEPVEYHGSAHITALVSAGGIIAVPIGVAEIPQGAVVEVRLI
jgi:molybdopterin molybdotransferase